MKTSARPRPRGIGLIEALLALLAMAFGMVALVQLQSHMRRSADQARQRGEAMRLAQQHLEQLRDYALLTPAYTGIASQAPGADIGDPEGSTRFSLSRTVTDL